jgi:hypothetical protein
MAGYVNGPQAAEWGRQRLDIAGEWPAVLVDLDLRYWADPKACDYQKRPSIRLLAAAWGWHRCRVERLLKRDNTETTPRQHRDNTETVDPLPKDAFEDERDNTETTPRQHRDNTETPPLYKRARASPSPSPPPSRKASSPPSTADGWAALSTRTVKALNAAGLHTPEAVAALTRRELKTRPGIGDKTASEIFIALDSLGLTFRPEPAKEPAIGKDVKPLTDAWARIWLNRRGHKYGWSWFKRDRRAARDFFGLCGTDVDLFERAVGHYFDAEDAGQWPERPASFSKAAHNASDWVNSARQVNGKGHTPANLKAEAAAVLGKINVLIRDRRWRPADLGDSPHADAARAGLAACGGIDDFRRSRDEIGDRIRFVAGYVERRSNP